MDSLKKQDIGLNRSHFAKLHDKIQNKYLEVQQKLQKHSSFESINDSDQYEKQSFSELSKSTSDLLNEMFQTDNFENSDLVKHELTCENIQKNYTEVMHVKSNESLVIVTNVEENGKVNYLQENTSLSSCESLNNLFENESNKSNHDSLRNSLGSQKFSIRERIGSHFAHAREKRRQSSKEKKAAKYKKKEKPDKFSLKNCKTLTMANYKREWIGVVSVALIKASGWNNDDFNDKQRQLIFRLRLGSEKVKSKLQRTSTTVAKWREFHKLDLFTDDTILEISLLDRDTLVGRTTMNLMELEKEKTHRMKINLEQGEIDVTNVQIFILVTITATVGNNLDSQTNQSIKETAPLDPYDIYEVGWLYVMIFCAKGLFGQDCYCIVDLGNERRQTLTENKTSDPNWMKSFVFMVNDITEQIIFTIIDEKKSEAVGVISIPLLRIKNGEKRFYALKDSTQKDRAKGNNPRILLQMRITWNIPKASLRVINPKEIIYMEPEEKIDRHLFARNVTRAKAIYQSAKELIRFWKALFEWESGYMNVIGLMLWIPFCWSFKVYMLPLLFVMPFLWYSRPVFLIWKSEDKIEVTEEKSISYSSLSQKLSSLQGIIQTVQNLIGDVAAFGERIKNLYNFSEPFLSWLFVIIMLIISFVLYLIPTRYIFIIWGIHKFVRKILRPNRVPNNEILDLLSRVPDDEILENCEELQLEETDLVE